MIALIRHLSLRIGILGASLLLLLVLSLTWLLTTTSGLRASLQLAERISAQSLVFEQVQGTWIDGLRIKHIHVGTSDTQLTLDNITLRIALRALLYKKIHIQHLHIDTFTQHAPSAQPPAPAPTHPAPFTLPALPTLPTLGFALQWDDVQIAKINVAAQHTQHWVSRGALVSTTRALKLDLQQLSANIQANPLTISGRLHWDASGLSAQNIKARYLNHFLDIDGTQNDLKWQLHYEDKTQQEYLHATGTLSQTKISRQLRARIKANLVRETFAVKHLDTELKLQQSLKAGLSHQLSNTLQLNAKALRVNTATFTAVDFHSQGHGEKQPFSLTFNPGGSAQHWQGHWRVNLDKLWQRQLDAAIDFTSTFELDLSTLAIPVEQAQGIVQGNLQGHGNFDNPGFTGKIAVNAATLALPSLGYKKLPADITIEKQHAFKNEITASAHLLAGKNPLTLTAKAHINGDNANAHVTLEGNQVLINPTDEWAVTVSPKLELRYEADRVFHLGGTINIPKATLKPKAQNTGSPLSEDFVVKTPDDKQRKKQRAPAKHALPLTLDVNLHLGDAVSITYGDFNALLSGKLHITQKPQQPLLGHGDIIIKKGRYQAHGQKLDVDGGRLYYLNDHLDDPRLDIKASKPVTVQSNTSFSPVTGLLSQDDNSGSRSEKTIEVGLKITGRASKPVYRLFSRPATLTDSEILSYLVLGQPLSAATAGNANLLMLAASQLKLPGKDVAGIGSQLQSWFGIDTIGIKNVNTRDHDSDTYSQKTALNIGKKISPKLYLDYTVGLFDPVNIFKLRYQIKKNWSIETQTSQEDSGVDLRYQFETE